MAKISDCERFRKRRERRTKQIAKLVRRSERDIFKYTVLMNAGAR